MDGLTSTVMSPWILVMTNAPFGTQWLETPLITQSQLFAVPQLPVVVFQFARFCAAAQEARTNNAQRPRHRTCPATGLRRENHPGSPKSLGVKMLLPLCAIPVT